MKARPTSPARRLWLGLAACVAVSLPTAVASAADPAPGPPTTDGVQPVLVGGNPNCASLGGQFGFKVDLSPNGTFTFTNTAPGSLTGGAPSDPANSVTISNSTGFTFDWSSTIGIDRVIVKASNAADSYVYTPEDTADGGLHGPLNTNSPEPTDYFAISHIEFCYDYEVTVTKTADTRFTRTFGWTIDKSVTPATWSLFPGDSGTSTYTVAVTKDAGTDSDFAVAGTITVANTTPLPATVTGVSDVISGGIGAVSVTCPRPFPVSLPAGGTLTCTYARALPNGAARTNTATAATSGNVGGDSGTAPVTFGAPTTTVDDSIDVDDTNGATQSFSSSGSMSYDEKFTCDDAGTTTNTASIRQTGAKAEATVTVNCYAITVVKNAETSWTRSWAWSIDKTADESSVTLATGQALPVSYSVTTRASSTAGAWKVAGKIMVSTPPQLPATITTVSDIVSPGIAAAVDCGPGVTFPYVIPADGYLVCSYTADLPDATDRTNTATAVRQNYDYSPTGTATPAGTTNESFTAAVTFDPDPTTEIDECISVSDTLQGALGTVCARDAPTTFTYSRYIGPYATCGDYTVDNVASFVTNDTATPGSDGHTIAVKVPCLGGCTLTQGYWKTHSDRGPAPYDDGWKAVGPAEEDTVFFLSGRTWYQVFWTPPAGNAYYSLAHQYMAAKLNVLNGASTTLAVDAAIAAAGAFFAVETPSTLSRADRATAISLASTLDQYNNGVIGPGHCTQ